MIGKLSLGISLLALLLGCSTTNVHRWGLPPRAVGITYCDAGHIRSVVDVAVLGAPERDEVLVHEAVHRQQISERPMQGGEGGCPRPYTIPELILDEVDAYCVSFDVAVSRGVPADSVRLAYLANMTRQFADHLGPHTVPVIIDAWARCGK